ncbi:MAG: response regulator [Proteobacteria bacterium]|nr:response regulator [Pseudomonadota bacterium]
MDKKQREFKVLLVDDEDVFREATARQLAVRGFVVLTANSGEAAVEVVNNDPPEVVVLDQQMPGMHGSDTFIAIKQINPLIEVIMLTGNTSVDNAIELMQMGTFDYLMKPINIDDLLYKIEDAYTRKKLNEKQQREAGQ